MIIANWTVYLVLDLINSQTEYFGTDILSLLPKTCEIGGLSSLGLKLRCLRSLNFTDHQFSCNSAWQLTEK